MVLDLKKLFFYSHFSAFNETVTKSFKTVLYLKLKRLEGHCVAISTYNNYVTSAIVYSIRFFKLAVNTYKSYFRLYLNYANNTFSIFSIGWFALNKYATILA